MSNRLNEPIEEEDTLEQWDLWDPMSEDYYSAKNTITLNPDKDPECTVTGEMMTTKLLGKDVCEHFIKYGTCADGQYCDRLHATPKARDQLLSLAKNYELNKGRTCLTYSYLSPIDLQPDRQKLLLVSVAYVRSPGDFILIFPYEQMDFSNFNDQDTEFYLDRVHQTSPYKTKLQKCHEQLAALFDHDYRLDNVDDDIYVSQIVACKLEDGRFCRAMVVETDDLLNEKFDYKLFLIDIGIVVERPRELIYDIRATCLSEPPMAVNARLNLKPADGKVKWPEEVLQKFREKLINKKYLLCKVQDFYAHDRTFVVDLFDVSTRTSFTDTMIKCGLADHCSSDKKKNDTLTWDSL